MNSRVHSLNTSPTHHKYSFSKENRFKYDKPKTDVYYLPRVDRDNRSALIGMGARSLATIGEKSLADAPHAYNIPSSISAKKGYSMKSGRYLIGGPLQGIKYKIGPGPSNYQVHSTLDSKGPTMKCKLADYSTKHLQGIPGPGAYSVPTTLKVDPAKGIFDSKFTTPGSVRLGSLSNSMEMSRRKEPVTFIPGPGQYDVQKYGMGNPQNPFDRHDAAKFPKEKRAGMAVKGSQKIPGPGLYKLFSQFD